MTFDATKPVTAKYKPLRSGKPLSAGLAFATGGPGGEDRLRPDNLHQSESPGAEAENLDASYSLRGLVREFRTGISRGQLARLAEQTPVNTAAALSVVLLISVFVAAQIPEPWIFVWAAAQAALILVVFLRWRKTPRLPAGVSEVNLSPTRSGLHQAVMWAALSGGLWGSLTAFLPDAPPHIQLALILTMGGMAAGASATLAAVPQVAIIFILACTVPVTAYHLTLGVQTGLLLALVFAIFTAAMLGTSQVVFVALMRQLRAEERARQLQEADSLRAIAEKANAALRESDARLRDAIESISEGFILYDADDRFVLCNSQYRDLYPDIADMLKPGAKFEDLARAALEAGAIQGSAEDVDWRLVQRLTQHRRADGVIYEQHLKDGRWVLCSERRTSTDGTVGIRTNITERKQAEDKLRHAHKMEAVGQLTGGVAHDINNLLAVIGGNAELLEIQGGSDPALTGPINSAVKRGAELTQRLLAFSRQQPLQPQAISLGELVSHMSDLLTRTLGETIEIRTRASPNLWNALADPGQVENALLNLTINARDAMPNGGKLAIGCANAQLDEAYAAENPEAVAGDYVVLAVSDDGTGMPAEVKARAFEPFFTTKEVGQGSGLGLSMVYGFAKQSGGHVTLDSEEGKGTTVRLYLPRAEEATQSKSASQDLPRGRGETILVIEDDPDVRGLAVKMLESLGYRVIDVSDAATAHRVLAEGEPVKLVLSDVVLPGGTGGPEFAVQARAAHPDLKIIFMSGYPADVATRDGFFGLNHVLMNKPFKRSQLAKALRAALD